MARAKRKQPWVLERAVFSALRRCDRNSPNYFEAVNAAKVEFTVLSKKGKPMRRVGFKCAVCGKICRKKQKGVPRTELAVDHIVPVIDPVTGYRTLDEYVERLFVPASARQVLCNVGKTSCHKTKTKAENLIRDRVRKEKKAYEQRTKEDAGTGKTDRSGASPGAGEVGGVPDSREGLPREASGSVQDDSRG